ncbi:hypothetical protein TRVL_09680 [Trypanosoma vivax]|nr:hypothetical protein TRVL_09680 [Trypanosoma vivax]
MKCGDNRTVPWHSRSVKHDAWRRAYQRQCRTTMWQALCRERGSRILAAARGMAFKRTPLGDDYVQLHSAARSSKANNLLTGGKTTEDLQDKLSRYASHSVLRESQQRNERRLNHQQNRNKRKAVCDDTNARLLNSTPTKTLHLFVCTK